MEKRNYGIDLLRIISMFLVVILHILGHGGVAAAVVPGSISAYLVQLTKAAAVCAVNVFAIITGFVMCDARPRISKLIQLWLQTAFYTISITVVFFLFFSRDMGIKDTLNAVLPVGRSQYWFISAYVGMYLLTPFLNMAVQNIEKRTYSGLLVVFFAAFSLLPTVLAVDMFTLKGGYSMVWLCLMYLLGGYMKRFDLWKKAKNGTLFLCYGLCVGMTFLSKVLMSWLGGTVLGRALTGDTFYQYVSPTVVLSAVFLVGAFSKMPIKGWLQKVVAFFAPAALGVYLIHDHHFVREKLWAGVGPQIGRQNAVLMVASILGVALAVLLACLVIDRLRIYLFKFMRIPMLCQKIERRTNDCWNKWNKE